LREQGARGPKTCRKKLARILAHGKGKNTSESRKEEKGRREEEEEGKHSVMCSRWAMFEGLF
jgi:hypothetical protein